MSPYSVFCHAYLPSSHLALPDWLNMPVVMPFFCVCVFMKSPMDSTPEPSFTTPASAGYLSQCEDYSFSRQDLLALSDRLGALSDQYRGTGRGLQCLFCCTVQPVEQDLPPACRWRPSVFVVMMEGWRLGIRTHGSRCEQGCSTCPEKQGKNVDSPKNQHCHFPDKYFLCCQRQLLFRRIMLCSCIWKQLLGSQPAAQLLNLPMKTLKKWGKFARKQVCNTARRSVSLLHASENLAQQNTLCTQIYWAMKI